MEHLVSNVIDRIVLDCFHDFDSGISFLRNGKYDCILNWKYESGHIVFFNKNEVTNERDMIPIDINILTECAKRIEKTNNNTEEEIIAEFRKLIFRRIITDWLSRYGINITDGTEKTIVKNIQKEKMFTEKEEVLKRYAQQINGGSDFRFISGSKKSGKTNLVKYWLSKNSDVQPEDVFFLDFNNNAYDFVDIIYLLTLKEDDTPICIVLDNIECCGINLSDKIIDFFHQLVKFFLQEESTSRIIVLEDSDNGFTKDFVSTEDTITLKDPIFIIENSNRYIENNLSAFASLSNIEDKSTVLELIVINAFGLDKRVRESKNAALLNPIYDLRKHSAYFKNAIKIKHEHEFYLISFLESKIAHMLLNRIIEKWNDIGLEELFDKYDSENAYDTIVKIITDYLKIRLYPSELDKYFSSSAYRFSLIKDSNTSINKLCIERNKDLEYIVRKCKAYVDKLVDEVNASTDILFDNHLGRIVFAAEAISNFTNTDWKYLKAWKKISKHVEKLYFIDTQGLPEVYRKLKNGDRTIYDFSSRGFSQEALDDFATDSIEKQIKLQNLFIDKFMHDGEPNSELLKHEACLNMALVSYEDQSLREVDIGRFCYTYMLALLIQMELSVPTILSGTSVRKERLAKLLQKMKDEIIEDGNQAYFYPKRVPWVTARFAFVLENAYRHRRRYKLNKEDVEYLENYIPHILNWISNNRKEFIVENTKLSTWLPGTGFWNDVDDTTIMCSLALIGYRDDYIEIAKEGINYCDYLFEHHPKRRSSDLTAFEAKLRVLLNEEHDSNSINRLFKSFASYLISDEGEEFDSDVSLGDTHTAQSLSSFIRYYTDTALERSGEIPFAKFAKRNPLIFVDCGDNSAFSKQISDFFGGDDFSVWIHEENNVVDKTAQRETDFFVFFISHDEFDPIGRANKCHDDYEYTKKSMFFIFTDENDLVEFEKNNSVNKNIEIILHSNNCLKHLRETFVEIISTNMQNYLSASIETADVDNPKEMSDKEREAVLIEKMKRTKPFDPNEPFLFISYSHKDWELVYKDVIRLKKRGINCWVDVENIEATINNSKRNWEDYVKPNLNKAELAFVYVSKNALSGEGFSAEVEYIINNNIDYVRITIGLSDDEAKKDFIYGYIDRQKYDGDSEGRKFALKRFMDTQQRGYYIRYEVNGERDHLKIHDVENSLKRFAQYIPQEYESMVRNLSGLEDVSEMEALDFYRKKKYSFSSNDMDEILNVKYFIYTIYKNLKTDYSDQDFQLLIDDIYNSFDRNSDTDEIKGLSKSGIQKVDDKENAGLVKMMQLDDESPDSRWGTTKYSLKNCSDTIYSDLKTNLFNYIYGQLVYISYDICTHLEDKNGRKRKEYEFTKNQLFMESNFQDGMWKLHRLPWITGRILTCLVDVYPALSSEEKEKTKLAVLKLADSLVKRNGTCYWHSGAQLWLSHYESSAICLEALLCFNGIDGLNFDSEISNVVDYFMRKDIIEKWLCKVEFSTDSDKYNNVCAGNIMLASVIYRAIKKQGYKKYASYLPIIRKILYHKGLLSILDKSAVVGTQFSMRANVIAYVIAAFKDGEE